MDVGDRGCKVGEGRLKVNQDGWRLKRVGEGDRKSIYLDVRADIDAFHLRS